MPRPSSHPEEEKSLPSITFPKGTIYEGEWKVRPPESREERRHRLQKEKRSFWVKEASSYLVALLILTGTAVYCFWVLFHPGLPREDRQWVMSVLTSLVAGIIGYLFGKVTT